MSSSWDILKNFFFVSNEINILRVIFIVTIIIFKKTLFPNFNKIFDDEKNKY